MCAWQFTNTIKDYYVNYDFTTTLIVISHESNAIFALQACLQATCVHTGWHICDQLDAKDADMEKVLLLCDVTITEVLAQWGLGYYIIITAYQVYFIYKSTTADMWYM